MINTEELGKLADLHQRGALTDEEFAQAKARILSGESARASSSAGPSSGSAAHAINTFHRSRTDRWIGGVCGGVGELTGVASWIWRLIFAALMMCAGTGVLFYILLWIFVPEE